MANDDVARMIETVREVGRAELKFTIAEPALRAVRTALGAGPTRVQHVYFLDTADLTLRRHGALARVRGGQQANDSVVKLRPMAPSAIPAVLRRHGDFTVEVDVTPDSFICSGALKRRLGRNAVERAVKGERGLRTLFSDQQSALLARQLPDGVVAFDELLPLGPVEVRRTRPHPDAAVRGLELQQWRYPDGSRLLEISTRCAAGKLIQTAARIAAFLDLNGIALAGPCPTKADTTLAYFSRQ
jgi:hypothetical protein